MTTQSKSAQNPGPTHTQNATLDAPQCADAPTLSPTAQHYIKLLESHYKAVTESFDMLTVFKNPSAKGAAAMVEDAELLRDTAKRLQVALSENGEPKPFKTDPPRRVSPADLIKRQNQERGLEPLPLEPELLLKRIADGGHSGQFLANAFLSAYRPDRPFHHGLIEIMKLDTEGFRLFHEILHIRHIPGWNDEALYSIEQQIFAIGGGK